MKRLPILKEYLDNSAVEDDYELPFLDDEEELTDAEQAELDAEDALPPFIDVDDIIEDDDVDNPLANPDLEFEKDEDDLFDDVLTNESVLLREASEGDAYRYMKKVLLSLPCADELEQAYGEDWSRVIFNMIRNDFVHSGCDVYFVPGLARILFGELNYDSENEDTMKIRQLHYIVEYITNHYRNHFTRNLALIRKDKTINAPYTFKQLFTVFGKTLADVAESLKIDLPIIKEAKKKKKLPIRKDYKKSSCGY